MCRYVLWKDSTSPLGESLKGLLAEWKLQVSEKSLALTIVATGSNGKSVRVKGVGCLWHSWNNPLYRGWSEGARTTGRSASRPIVRSIGSQNMPQNLMEGRLKRLFSWKPWQRFWLILDRGQKICTLPASREILMQLACSPHSERKACIQGLSFSLGEGAQVLWFGVEGTSPTGS